MASKDQIMYIFDIDNVREQYAFCLEFIMMLENKCKLDDVSELKRAKDIVNAISVSGSRLPKIISPNYFEEPLQATVYGSKEIEFRRSPVEQKKRLSGEDFTEKLLSVSQSTACLYHVRIHFRKQSDGSIADMVYLQYLALMMQSLEFLFIDRTFPKKQLSVFLVPTSGEIFPYRDFRSNEIDFETYIMASRYLRLLAKSYCGIIYGVEKREDAPIVRALNFKDVNRSNNHFPLIPINGFSYGELFEEKIDDDALIDLFALRSNRRYRQAGNENPITALRDYVAETSLRKLQSLYAADKEQQKMFFECVQEVFLHANIYEHVNPVNWITFSLFSFILRFDASNKSAATCKKKIQETLRLADDLSSGIRQIVQNAIQHSEKKACVFSFCLHAAKKGESDSNFEQGRFDDIEEIFKRVAPETIPAALEILIADSNSHQNMIDNFIENIRWEYALAYETGRTKRVRNYEDLIKTGQEKGIAVSNFFNQFETQQSKEAWYSFRRADSSAHIGLVLFAQTAKRCKASVEVISTTNYAIEPTQYYFHSYGVENSYGGYIESEMPSCTIPGTQFSIVIPVLPVEAVNLYGLAQLNNPYCFREDYKTFAQFLGAYANPMEMDIPTYEEFPLICRLSISNAKDKYHIQQIWANIWADVLGDQLTDDINRVTYVDFNKSLNSDYFLISDNCEVFLKGLFDAFCECDIRQACFFAIINVPPILLSTLRRVCLSLAIKDFPTHLQFFVSENLCQKQVQLFGNSFEQAIQNAYILSLEHGTGVLSSEDPELAEFLVNPFSNTIDQRGQEARLVMPFDVILPIGKGETKSIFDKRIERLAENPIDKEPFGYKLESTHMRLGSKVHIESFYEMSYLFYRTNIANRVAFEILQSLYTNEPETGINIFQDTILFYGYASYSKAILTSIVEILKESRTSLKQNIAFASFQHNLQDESASEDIQLYFNFFEGFNGALNDKNQATIPENTKIVQIVPISSTLTTFEKMLKRLQQSLTNSKEIIQIENYTVFWVRDESKGMETPSDIELKYWNSVDLSSRTVFTENLDIGTMGVIRYFMQTLTVWHTPLECNQCFPLAAVNEIPLVETDPTSTVPTQQIRAERDETVKPDRSYVEKNCVRVLKLNECVYYGHIARGKNHFQYYIDTQQYFYKVKDEVSAWLRELRFLVRHDSINPALCIIFSPEHNTNVGFAQYVNTYYFGGSAEIISVNEDKEYRSNFKCEHAALIKIIQKLHERGGFSWHTSPVEFYFVDDTIITGDTFTKANNFMHSLIPNEYAYIYPTNLFKKCFILIDRLSESTKGNYVENAKENFHSFLHIDISNIRRQGDSCIGCKLRHDAMRLFKRSTTRNSSNYWAMKVENFKPISFDNMMIMRQYKENNAFERLVISHIVQNAIFVDNDSFSLGSTFDVLLHILSLFQGDSSLILNKQVAFRYNVLIDYLMRDDTAKEKSLVYTQIFIKIISRPFFSFDFKIKLQVLSLLIILSDAWLDTESSQTDIVKQIDINDPNKKFLLENNRISSTLEFARNLNIAYQKNKFQWLKFYQDTVLESLADLRSTYLLRKATMKKMYAFLKNNLLTSSCPRQYSKEKSCKYHSIVECNGNPIRCFLYDYASCIHRIIDCSSDETRALWLEYLLMNGEEYTQLIKNHMRQERTSPIFLYNTIVDEDIPILSDCFEEFCNEVFLQNNRIIFDGIEKAVTSSAPDGYFMENWRTARNWNHKWMSVKSVRSIVYPSDEEIALFDYLVKKTSSSSDIKMEVVNKRLERSDVRQRYDKLLEKMSAMIQRKYMISGSDISIALLTQSNVQKNKDMIYLDIVTSRLPNFKADEAETKYIIKERVLQALKKMNESSQLETLGYFVPSQDKIYENYNEDDFAGIGEKKDQFEQPYFILFFDNPNSIANISLGRDLKPISRVFLYISTQVEYFSKYVLWLIMRDILSYRNRLLRFLEDDFNGDIMEKFAHTAGQKNILEHEKSVSHTTTADDEIEYMFLTHQYNMIDAQGPRWLILRSYTNRQIAKLFSRNFSDENPVKNQPNMQNVPLLYVSKDERTFAKTKFMSERLEVLGNLKDRRFEMIESIINFEGFNELQNAGIATRNGQDGNNLAYNLEYFRCVLIDILLTAIKFASKEDDFLRRVAKFYTEKDKRNTEQDARCIIVVYREENPVGAYDYLVIKNPVIRGENGLDPSNYQDFNRMICMRLQDPIDFPDGHMSLFVIKRFVEGLTKQVCVFEYCVEQICNFQAVSVRPKRVKEQLFFVTKLPMLLKKGGDTGE